MKKFLTLTALSIIVSSPAFALSEGDYLELDGVYTDTSYYHVYNSNDIIVRTRPTNSSGTNGVGLTFKSAYNFENSNFFLAPGVFVEQNSFGSSSVSGYDKVNLQIRNRLGARIDLGYDFDNGIAPYVTAGYAYVRYNSRSSGTDLSNNWVTATRTGSSGNEFFGFGARFPLKNKNLSLNFEYNYQTFDTKNAVPVQASDYLINSQYRTRLDIYKVGLSYKF